MDKPGNSEVTTFVLDSFVALSLVACVHLAVCYWLTDTSITTTEQVELFTYVMYAISISRMRFLLVHIEREQSLDLPAMIVKHKQ